MNKEAVAEHPDILKGSIYAIAAFFCMAVFGVLTKAALEGGSVFWVSFIAYLTGSLALVPFLMQQGLSSLKSKHYSFLIGRAVFGTIASFSYTISIHYIPLVNGTLLFNTAPLFIPILATLFLKEKIAKSTWLAVFIGFIGIIIIIKPTEAIFSQTGNLIAVFSGISLAIAYLLMKLLTATDPGIRIIFYYLGIGTFLQIPALFFVKQLPSIESCLYAMLGGMFLLTAQLSLVQGYRYAKASQIGIYQYMSVVFVGLFDWLLWNAIPTYWEVVGILLVMSAGILVIKSSSAKLQRSA